MRVMQGGNPPLELTRPSIPDAVWLFHGTSTETAQDIVRRGWSPPDPSNEVRQFAIDHKLDPDEFVDEYTIFGVERHLRSEASCASGWRLAADYARRSPEYLYFARGKLRMLQERSDHWVEPDPAAEDAAVLVLRVPWAVLGSLVIGHRGRLERQAFLPDSVMEDAGFKIVRMHVTVKYV